MFQDKKDKIFKGIEYLEAVVASTMGAAGKPAVLEPPYAHSAPVVTRDGVTAAMAVNSRCKLEMMGIELVRQAALSANNRAGDGTSASSVLAVAMIRERLTLQEVFPKLSTTLIEQGMDLALEEVLKVLDTLKLEGDLDIESIATISCNNDTQMGKIISDAYKKVGAWGSIILKTGVKGESSFREIQGAEFEIEMHPQFCLNKKQVVLNNPKILLTDFVPKDLDFFDTNQGNVVRACLRKKTPLVIITPTPQAKFLRETVMKNMEGVPIYVVAAPEFGTDRYVTLRDLAQMTQGELVSSQQSNEWYGTLESLGTCEEIILKPDSLFIGGYESPKDLYQIALDEVKEKDSPPTDFQRRRLGRLAGKAAEITVVEPSESARKRILDRVEDSLNSTRAALLYGAVSGGGVALRDVQHIIREDKGITGLKAVVEGWDVVINCLNTPYKTILKNASMESASYLGKGVGVDVLTHNIVNMAERGIIDPVEVIKSSLTAAVGIAKLIPSIGAVVTNEMYSTNDSGI